MCFERALREIKTIMFSVQSLLLNEMNGGGKLLFGHNGNLFILKKNLLLLFYFRLICFFPLSLSLHRFFCICYLFATKPLCSSARR